jgi:hypothetical protein
MTQPSVKVAVGPRTEFDRRASIFCSIARAWSVEFVPAARDASVDGVLWFATNGSDGTPIESVVAEFSSGPIESLVLEPVEGTAAHEHCAFSRDRRLDSVLRDQTVLDRLGAAGLASQGNEIVFASCRGRPVWIRDLRSHRDRVAFASDTPPLCRPPSADLGQDLTLAWIAVLHWIREISGDRVWRPNGIRASLLFDDPNLHARSYGWLNFPRLASAMKNEGAHCSIATVPLDAWYIDPKAAQIFRDERPYLSLSMHGNDHLHYEMARGPNDEARRRMMIQAMQRIASLERRAKVDVDRIVIPPHSRFDDDARTVLWDFPLLGLCCGGDSARSVRVSDPNLAWLGPAEVMSGRCPVFDRYHMTAPRHGLVWRAFFGHPLILYGHHQEMADGDAVVVDACRWVNKLGAVRWMRLQNLARSNYLTRRVGRTLEVRAFSHDVELALAEDVDSVRVSLGFDEPMLGARCEVNGQMLEPESNHVSFPVTDDRIRVTIRTPRLIDPLRLPATLPGARAVLRRALTEGRDRALPLLRQR